MRVQIAQANAVRYLKTNYKLINTLIFNNYDQTQ